MKNPRLRRHGLLALGLVMLALGGPMLVYGGQAVLEQQREGFWVRVPAKATHVEHKPRRRYQLGDCCLRRGESLGSVFPVVVTFAYEVDGKTYEDDGYNVRGGTRVFSSESGRALWTERLMARDDLTVVHHPADPSIAVMEYRPVAWPMALAMGGAMLLLMAMPVFVVRAQAPAPARDAAHDSPCAR